MTTVRTTPGRSILRGTAALAILLACLASAPPLVGLAARHLPGRSDPSAARAESSGVSAAVTWGGTNISQAGTVSSAFVVDGEATVSVVFRFDANGSTDPPASAEVVLTYLGEALTSTGTATGVAANGSGVASFPWSFGDLVELTEGAYALTAALLDANGSTLWSQVFYINVEAPYRVSSGLFVFLAVLGAVEAYSISVALRRHKVKHLPRPPRRTAPPPPPPRAPRTGGT